MLVTPKSYKEFLTVEVPKKLKLLKANTQPQWGKMTAQHMVEHLILMTTATLVMAQSATDTTNPTQMQWKQNVVMSDEPLPKFIENPIYKNGMPAYEHATIEIACQKLVEKINQFFKVYETHPNARNYHMFFGDLNFDELQRLHWKHFTHHLTQFGLLNADAIPTD